MGTSQPIKRSNIERIYIEILISILINFYIVFWVNHILIRRVNLFKISKITQYLQNCNLILIFLVRNAILPCGKFGS